MRISLLAMPSLLLIAACNMWDDELKYEKASPDGALVARAWCIELCDFPEQRTITISKAERPAGSDAPSRDVAVRIHYKASKDADLQMVWTAPRELEISAPCLADLNFALHKRQRQFRDVLITFVRMPGKEDCWGQLAPEGERGV